MPVAVIGGGVVGAAVTYALARRGVGALLLEEAAELLPTDRRVEPQRDDQWRAREHERWRAFVTRAAGL